MKMLINSQKVPRFGGKYQFRDSKSSAKDTYSQISNTKESESEVAQSCPTLCDPVDCSPPGSSVHGILQARVLEWAAISFFRGSSRPRDRTHVSPFSCTGRWILYHCMLLRVISKMELALGKKIKALLKFMDCLNSVRC